MQTMNIVMKVCYDGTHFCGWQIQDNGRTVQGELERAVTERFGIVARVTGSGRTDAGVHAAGQICNFAMDDAIRITPGRIADALNTVLPADVRVQESARAEDSFDACRSAKKKTYRYSIYFARREVPLLERYAVRFAGDPDLSLMRKCARLLEGEHDFAAFSATGSSVKTTVRTVYSVGLVPWETAAARSGLHIDVCGNGFLYNMVRIMAGVLLDFGCGKISESSVRAALEGGGRALLGKTMPAKGLTLQSADYGYDLFGKASE